MKTDPMPEPTVAELVASHQGTPGERELAAHYAPIIHFNEREPFLPLAVGYTIFRADGASPSFDRTIVLAPPGKPPAVMAIEYALWWDWDIGHLYELEHIWAFIDGQGRVVRGEASAHGHYLDLSVDGCLPLTGDRLTVYSEPGKHAFVPMREWLDGRAESTLEDCTTKAGEDGVLVTRLFQGKIWVKTPEADRLVRDWLRQQAFTPGPTYNRVYAVSAEVLVPWPALYKWIPRRVAWCVAQLERPSSSRPECRSSDP